MANREPLRWGDLPLQQQEADTVASPLQGSVLSFTNPQGEGSFLFLKLLLTLQRKILFGCGEFKGQSLMAPVLLPNQQGKESEPSLDYLPEVVVG